MAYTTHLLVVASVTATSDDLLAALQARAERGPIHVTLLVPLRAAGAEARVQAEADLQDALARWREHGLEAAGQVGDSDPVAAAHDIWDPGRFDEVVVSTLPGSASRWLTIDVPHRIARITDAPVTHVLSRPPGWGQPKGGPPPKRERNPLSVLSWGTPRRV